MSENSAPLSQQSNDSSPNSNTSAASTRKSTAERKTGSNKKGLGKSTFRLPIELDRAVRLASIMLEQAGKENHTPSELVVHAVTTYMKFLQDHKKVDFHGIITFKSATATKLS